MPRTQADTRSTRTYAFRHFAFRSRKVRQSETRQGTCVTRAPSPCHPQNAQSSSEGQFLSIRPSPHPRIKKASPPPTPQNSPLPSSKGPVFSEDPAPPPKRPSPLPPLRRPSPLRTARAGMARRPPRTRALPARGASRARRSASPQRCRVAETCVGVGGGRWRGFEGGGGGGGVGGGWRKLRAGVEGGSRVCVWWGRGWGRGWGVEGVADGGGSSRVGVRRKTLRTTVGRNLPSCVAFGFGAPTLPRPPHRLIDEGSFALGARLGVGCPAGARLRREGRWEVCRKVCREV